MNRLVIFGLIYLVSFVVMMIIGFYLCKEADSDLFEDDENCL